MVSSVHEDAVSCKTLKETVIALWALAGLDGLDLLTTAKERMFLEENDFQYVLSKLCFSHNLL